MNTEEYWDSTDFKEWLELLYRYNYTNIPSPIDYSFLTIEKSIDKNYKDS